MAELADVIAALEELRRLAPRVSYRVEDAAAQVGISRSEMYRLVERGVVRRVPHMGRSVVISHTELERVFGSSVGSLRSAS